MIRERLLAVRERRAALVIRASQQRDSVQVLVRRTDAATAWIDRARAVLEQIKARPAWIAAAVALLVVLRPRKTLSLIATGASLWRTWRSLRAWTERLSAAPPTGRGGY